jgi:hypothetical protein
MRPSRDTGAWMVCANGICFFYRAWIKIAAELRADRRSSSQTLLEPKNVEQGGTHEISAHRRAF